MKLGDFDSAKLRKLAKDKAKEYLASERQLVQELVALQTECCPDSDAKQFAAYLHDSLGFDRASADYLAATVEERGKNVR